MKGIVATHFKEFVETNLSEENWKQVMTELQIPSDDFGPSDDLPDETVVKVVVTAAKTADKEVGDVLFDFGDFEMTKLFGVYAHLVSQKTAKEFLLTAHDKISMAVNKDFQGAGEQPACPFVHKYEPPLMEVKETGPDTLKLFYRSPRKLCAFNRGILKAVAAHYNVKIDVDQKACMDKGDKECEYDLTISSN